LTANGIHAAVPAARRAPARNPSRRLCQKGRALAQSHNGIHPRIELVDLIEIAVMTSTHEIARERIASRSAPRSS